MSADFSPTPIFYGFLGFIIGLILGWVTGFFDSNNRSAKKIQAAETSAQTAIEEAERKTAEANRQIAEFSAQPASAPDDPGILRLKKMNGQYALEMDGISIQSALPPAGKQRLIELLTAIRPYLEGGVASQPIQTPPASAPRVNPPAESPALKVSAPPAAAPPPQAESSQEKKTASDPKALAALSMVGQVDAILQAQILDTPLGKRGIRLSESAQGGLEVEVGLEKFPTVGDVPYPEAQAAIRAAIAEWEKKFTPGM